MSEKQLQSNAEKYSVGSRWLTPEGEEIIVRQYYELMEGCDRLCFETANGGGGHMGLNHIQLLTPLPADAPPSNLVPFDHENLDRFFQNVRKVEVLADRYVRYLVRGEVNWVDEIVFLTPREIRIHIDNYPAQKLGFSSNLPIRFMHEFESDMRRVGLKLIKIPAINFHGSPPESNSPEDCKTL